MIYSEVQSSLKDFHRLAYFSTTDQEMLYAKPSLRQWIDSGATMGMGTDSGTPMNFHTEALWREIKAHVDVGMSPQRAITAATRINARILGEEKTLGTIEPASWRTSSSSRAIPCSTSRRFPASRLWSRTGGSRRANRAPSVGRAVCRIKARSRAASAVENVRGKKTIGSRSELARPARSAGARTSHARVTVVPQAETCPNSWAAACAPRWQGQRSMSARLSAMNPLELRLHGRRRTSGRLPTGR